MARKKRLIIPVFIPFGGCPNRCVFCDQFGVAGAEGLPGPEEVASTIELYLFTWRGTGRREVAFYGGSFTGLPTGVQERYLDVAVPYLADGRLDGVRVSTRPDYIDPAIAGFLRARGVDTVELGVQSMDESVLELSGRGHTRADTVRAVGLLRDGGFSVGVQVMPGLPGDTVDTILATADELAALGPDFARVYPTLVLAGTELHGLYEKGEYEPWPLDEMAGVCAEVCRRFTGAGVRVIRVGLQPTRELERQVVAGPYHPAFRELLAPHGAWSNGNKGQANAERCAR